MLEGDWCILLTFVFTPQHVSKIYTTINHTLSAWEGTLDLGEIWMRKFYGKRLVNMSTCSLCKVVFMVWVGYFMMKPLKKEKQIKKTLSGKFMTSHDLKIFQVR